MAGENEEEYRYSKSTKICGRSEEYAVDVVKENSEYLLLTKAKVVGDTAATVGMIALSKNFRIDWYNTETTYNGANWNTIYNYSGSGFLYGFHIDPDSANLMVRLTIDTNVIFELEINFLKELGFSKPSNELQSGGLVITTPSSEFDFSPRYVVKFDSNIKIEIKDSNNTNIKIKRWLVAISKET